MNCNLSLSFSHEEVVLYDFGKNIMFWYFKLCIAKLILINLPMFPFIQLLHITSINVPPVSAFKQQSFTQRLLVDYDPSTTAEWSVVLSNLIYQLVSFLHGTNFS